MPRKKSQLRLPKLRRGTNNQAFIEYKLKRHYLGVWGTDEVNQRYAECLKQIVSAKQVVPRKRAKSETECTLNGLIQRYLQTAEMRSSPKEFREDKRALLNLSDFCGTTPGDEFGPLALTAFQTYCMTLKDQRAKDQAAAQLVSRTYVNKIVKRVRHFIKWCCANEKIPAEQYHKLQTVRPLMIGDPGTRESDPILPVDDEIVQATLPFMKPVIATMVQMQLLCGMRPGEVCRMKMSDIDRKLDIWLYKVQRHKRTRNGQVLYKALNVTAQAVLKDYLREDPDEPLFSPLESEVLRVSQNIRARRRKKIRNYYDTESYNQAIENAIKKAKRAGVEIPHWHALQIRHSSGTQVSQLLGQQAAQRWLGHKNLNTTNIYTESQTKELIHIARELDRHSHDSAAQAQAAPELQTP